MRICVPNKSKDLKLFNMITNRNKSLIKHISCDCKCKFNSSTYNSN